MYPLLNSTEKRPSSDRWRGWNVEMMGEGENKRVGKWDELQQWGEIYHNWVESQTRKKE